MSADRSGDPPGVLHPGDARFVVALAAVDPFPRQLNELVFRFGAEAAWHRVLRGSPGIKLPDDIARAWQHRAVRIDPDKLWAAHHRAGAWSLALEYQPMASLRHSDQVWASTMRLRSISRVKSWKAARCTQLGSS